MSSLSAAKVSLAVSATVRGRASGTVILVWMRPGRADIT